MLLLCITAILAVVRRVAEKHCDVLIKEEHYPIVGANLLGAIKEVLGTATTDEIIESWGTAYGVIAEIFIGIEKEIYASRK